MWFAVELLWHYHLNFFHSSSLRRKWKRVSTFEKEKEKKENSSSGQNVSSLASGTFGFK